MKITWRLVVLWTFLSISAITLTSPCFSESTSDDRYEIFTVYPRPLTDGEKFSVLLDKKTGRMWNLEKSFFAIEGRDTMAEEIVWKPAQKFDNWKDYYEWSSNVSKTLNETNKKK